LTFKNNKNKDYIFFKIYYIFLRNFLRNY